MRQKSPHGDGTNGDLNSRPDSELHSRVGLDLTSASSTGRRAWRAWVLVIGVFVVPGVLYAMLLVVPLLPLTTGQKVWISTGLVVAAEGTFLISALVLGRQAVRRYRCFLNPRNWFGRIPD